MTRYLLDTNIISDAVQPKPSEALNDCIVATGNERHFRDVVEMVHPRRA